jgi:hypothetical protein
MTMLRLAVLLVLLATTSAPADPIHCRGDIVKASAKHAQAAAKILRKCADHVLAGTLPPSADCHADPMLVIAGAKLAASVARSCCGADGTCGTGDDEALAAVGWDVGQCPDFETLGCDTPIASFADVATCLACVGDAAAAQLVELPEDPPASAAVRCRRAMDRELARYFRAGSKALARCWAARNQGLHANPCPDPGDGIAAAALAAAATHAHARTCAACGGADRACGGGDDVALVDLASPDHCPSVTVPGGSACGGPIGSLDDLVGCVGCLAAFEIACADRAAVPAFASYPAECNPPSPMCGAGVTCETSLDCPTGYTCRDNGSPTHYCVGAICTTDGDCGGGGVCRQYCTRAGCGERQCQCPGFGCSGPDELCIDDGGLACRKLCTQDSDCTDPFGFVCVNPGFGFGVCIGQTPCQ